MSLSGTRGWSRGGLVSLFCVGIGFRFFGRFLADRTYGRAIGTVLRLSSVVVVYRL